jgi:aspartyl-tRNA(Asn)/glutamyl-tRNA(Gln) amidotransferase subunit B
VEFVPVIGLEVHAQLRTRGKLFSPCPVEVGAPPNARTEPYCLGLPGTLPWLNEYAVDLGLRLGLALGCDIPPSSAFDRKNYFYPDLPKGYQITQHDAPLCRGGSLRIRREGRSRLVELLHVHLEEDAGKSIHDPERRRTYVDLNRAGTPLLEIVTRPQIEAPEDAGAFLETLRHLMRWIDVCDGNMEEGSLRCDANISVRPAGDPELGARVEIKNLNSIRALVTALDYEADRQAELLRAGASVDQETRGWDPERSVTFRLRGKESAPDYRYFAEPDLPELVLDPARLGRIRREMPELPEATRQRLRVTYGLAEDEIEQITEAFSLNRYFEAAVGAGADATLTVHWILGELRAALNRRRIPIEEFEVGPRRLAELLALVKDGIISQTAAKEVFAQMLHDERPVLSIVDERNLRQIQDDEEMLETVERILDQHPRQVRSYLGGKVGLLAWFIGQLMRSTGGRADPRRADALVREALERRR